MHRKMGVAMVAALGLVAGCGSSGPLTSAQLARQATTICRQRNAQILVLRTQHRGVVTEVARAAVPTETKAIDALAGLEPPASARASYGRFIAIEQIYLRELKAQVAGRSRSGGTRPDRTHEVWSITERLGIKACQ